jgi:hypothetical protein
LLGAVVVSRHRERGLPGADDCSDAAGAAAGIVGRPRRAGAADKRRRSDHQMDEQPHEASEASAVLPACIEFSICPRYVADMDGDIDAARPADRRGNNGNVCGSFAFGRVRRQVRIRLNHADDAH